MDPKKKAVKTHKENEAIQFDFDITADDFDEIASEMYKSGLILEEDSRAVAKLLKVQVHTLLKDRKERIAQAQAAAKEKELAKLQHALEQHHQMMYQQQQQQQQQQQRNSQNNFDNPNNNNQIINTQQNINIQHQQLQNMVQQNQIQHHSIQNHSPMIQSNISAPTLPTTPLTMNQNSQAPQNILLTPQQIQTIAKPENIQVTPIINQQPNQKLPVPQQHQQHNQHGQGNVPINNYNNNNTISNHQHLQQTPSPVVSDQSVKIAQQKGQADSGISTGTPQSATSNSSLQMKKRRSNKSSERYPKLVVLSLVDEKL
jgi:WNK lysine deficient protein kinase